MKNSSWRKKVGEITHNVCRGCPICDGHACRGEVPGMGGAGDGSTFIANVRSWNALPLPESQALPELGVAPMCGVADNMGNPISEEGFHYALVKGAKEAGILSCIGDGAPDHKLYDGVKALEENNCKGAGIIKPYPDLEIINRYHRISHALTAAGIDIDAFGIATMNGKVVLEDKTAQQLKRLKQQFHVPFIIKGIYSLEQVPLVAEVKPDIIVISNHGGRILPGLPGIGGLCAAIAEACRKYTGEIWVDSGIRTLEHLYKAKAAGADRVLIGRPFIQGVVALGPEGIAAVLAEQFGIHTRAGCIQA